MATPRSRPKSEISTNACTWRCLRSGWTTAQIKSAYVQPASRGKGIGKALLRAAVQWAQRQGYDRVFVEHETANYYGGRFWGKHFAPYLYFSMRYVDSSI